MRLRRVPDLRMPESVGRGRQATGWFGPLVVGTAFVLSSCGGKAKEGPSTAADVRVRRSTAIELEPCAVDGDGVLALDADLDGHPEVRRKMAGDREECRVADLNADGKVDRTTFYEPNGQVRRIESDFDRDGRVDEIALFSGGMVQEKRRATTLNGKLDTWEFYEKGALVRTERDKNGDSIIDQWWEYPSPGCPLIHTDGDGDGRPDPQTTIDYCKATGYVPPEAVKARQDVEQRSFESSAPPVTEIREVSNEPDSPSGASAGGGPAAASAPGTGGSPGTTP